MYRITIKKIPDKTNEVILTIEKEVEPTKFWDMIPVSRCQVKFEKGCTSYLPIPPDKSFGAIPEEVENQVRNVLRAYHDGAEGRDSYAWTG